MADGSIQFVYYEAQFKHEQRARFASQREAQAAEPPGVVAPASHGGDIPLYTCLNH
jgi:hypothetical protein